MRSHPFLLGALALALSACASTPKPAPRPRPSGTEVVFRVGGRQTSAVRAAPSDEPGAEERAAYAAVRDAQATPEAILEAALWASGVDDASERARLQAQVRTLVEKWRPEVNAEGEITAQGRKLLALLHDDLFRGYVRDQTYVDVVLESGLFDCESAALVYLVTGRMLGLAVEPANGPGHALVQLVAGAQRIEVEPTRKDGFDPPLDPTDFARFLHERGLPHAPHAPATGVSPALLVGRVVLQRLAFAHDGQAQEGTAEEARLQRVWEALERRAILLAPADRIVARTQAVRLERRAVRLVNEGQQDAGMLLQRASVQLSGAAGVDAERAFGNLRWAAFKRVERALRANDFGEAERTLREVEATVGCDERSQQCAEVKRLARESFWAEAIARDKAGRRAEVWPVVEALLERFPDPGRHENQLYFAQAEADRRWAAGDREGADGLLVAEIRRGGCEGARRRSCAEAANHAAFLWFKADLARAATWAREAYGYDPEAHGVRDNFAAALHNLALRHVTRQECSKAKELAAELAQAKVQKPELATAVARCRKGG